MTLLVESPREQSKNTTIKVTTRRYHSITHNPVGFCVKLGCGTINAASGKHGI